MKKFISLIALAAFMVACTPEQVETAFKLAGGKVLVEVEVVDIINGGQYGGPVNIKFFRGGLDVTQEFTPIVGAGPHAYSWQAAESQAVPAGDYVVGVNGDNLAKEYTSNLAIPAVLAGGEAIVKVVVPVGEPINGWTPYVIQGDWKDEGTDVAFLVNNDYQTHAYSHDGIDSWYYNNTEFAIPGTVDYNWDLIYVATNVVDNNILGFEGVVEGFVETVEDESDYDEMTYEFTASAWCMWNVTQTSYFASCPITIIAFKDENGNGEIDANEDTLELGSFDIEMTYADLVEYHELPYPGAEGHYTPGHGHDAHGTMPNAGGGMSIND